MADCARRRGIEDRIVRCEPLSDQSGFIRSVEKSLCDRCLRDGDPDPAANRTFGMLFVDGLKGRLLAGDCRRFQGANPVNLDDAMGKLVAVAGVDQAGDHLKAMLRYQAAITEADGGDSPEVLAQKLTALAERRGLVRPLQDGIDDQLRTTPP